MTVVVGASLRSPKARVSEETAIAGQAACKRKPLHIVGSEDVVLKGEVDAGMCRSRGDNRGKVWRKFFQRGPLIESGVGASPHGDFAVAPRLLREPFDDIVAIARVIGEGLECPPGITAPAHIHQRVNVAMLREIDRAIRITV